MIRGLGIMIICSSYSPYVANEVPLGITSTSGPETGPNLNYIDLHGKREPRVANTDGKSF